MRVLVLLSGGRDSVCLLDRMVAEAEQVWALHVNYGLRGAESDADEAFCRELCSRLGVELFVLRAGEPSGNVQGWARDVRYAEAERLASELDALIAVGHTATDQVETVLYRLAASPGRRALLGMPARSGRVIRPLLGLTREQTAEHCRARGLAWREDSSNAASARGLIRGVVLPGLRQLHPAAEANILATLEQLREEAAVLDEWSQKVTEQPFVTTSELAALPPALARLVIQRLAGEGAPSLAAHAGDIVALSTRPGTVTLDLPGGLRAISEYGRVRIEPPPATSEPMPQTLSIPGRVAFGDGEVVSERGPFPIADGTLAADALAATLEVRAWRAGDRMRPLGLGGSKSLQDLFTDRRVPRDARHKLPVVVSDGEIAWVPGVATGERFRVGPETGDRVRLAWRLDCAAP
jgi:tRNA(Ile)-lysidine synthase